MPYRSKDIAKVAILLAMSSREEEALMKQNYEKKKIQTCAVDIGGEIIHSVEKILERALVSAKKNRLIPEGHVYDGAVVGAAREALNQVMGKAGGMNVGGKIGIARSGEHLALCIFLTIGLLHLDEVVIGLAHRAIPNH